MELGTIAQWGSVAVASLALVVSLLAASRRDLVAALGKAGEEIRDLESRVDRVESELEHMPSRDMTHSIELALGDMKASIGVLTERVNTTREVAGRLERFLEEQRK